MMKYKIIPLVILCLMGNRLQAQDENDAIRYGFGLEYGTARSQGIGNAIGSVGANLNAVYVNPAGLGIYRSSDFSLTPSLQFLKTNSSFQGTTQGTTVGKFNFNQVGVVINNTKKGKKYSDSRWKSSSIALSLSRNANFHRDYEYSGNDNQSSFAESAAEQFNQYGGINTNSLNGVSDVAYGLYQTYVLDTLGGPTVQAFVPYTSGLRRSKYVTETGSNMEYALAFGANYNEKFFIGATLGIPQIRYNSTRVLSEDDISGNADNDFNYIDVVEKLSTQGTGINLKLGAIIKPTQNLRFGFAFHTPSLYQLTDVYYAEVEADLDSFYIRNGITSGSSLNYRPDESLSFTYNYSSPLKAVGSATVLFGKMGFLSADIEYVDYAGMRYTYSNSYQDMAAIQNKIIQDTYKPTFNTRIGAEFRLPGNLFARAGYGFYGSPYRKYSAGGMSNYSLGLGFQTKSFYMDMAYRYSAYSMLDKTHELNRDVDIPVATIKNKINNVGLTFGWRF